MPKLISLGIEFFLIATTILYVIGASLNKKWCWYFGISNAILYAIISFSSNYFLDFALQGFYIIFGFWGLKHWSKPENEIKKVKNLPKLTLVYLLLLGSLSALVLGYLFEQLNSDKSYLDAFTTTFALIATFLTVKKYIENWLIWLVLNPIWFYMYWVKGNHIMVIMFIILFVFAIIGFINWRKLLHEK